MDERDRITEALMAQQEPPQEPGALVPDGALPPLEALPDARAEGLSPVGGNVAPLWAMRRPKGSGLLPGGEVNAFPVMPSTFQASAGTEDFDRMYRKAGGDSGGGPSSPVGGDYSKLMMLMGG